jgi:dimethylamine---corrinoid protein Co-methyltransferase
MPVAHGVAAGMGGMRAAGDLVARLQMAKGMRLAAAKAYVAGKLGVAARDLSDCAAMQELRGELGLGRINDGEAPHAFDPSPMEAKANVGRLLDLPINSVTRFEARRGA